MTDPELDAIRKKRLEEIKNKTMTQSQPVVHLNSENFNAFVTQIPNVVIDFWAEWCGPCRMFAPVFEEVSLEYPEVQFCKCNTDENRQIASHLRISAIPTIIYAKNGTAVKLRAGALNKEEFRKELDSVYRS